MQRNPDMGKIRYAKRKLWHQIHVAPEVLQTSKPSVPRNPQFSRLNRPPIRNIPVIDPPRSHVDLFLRRPVTVEEESIADVLGRAYDAFRVLGETERSQVVNLLAEDLLVEEASALVVVI